MPNYPDEFKFHLVEAMRLSPIPPNKCHTALGFHIGCGTLDRWLRSSEKMALEKPATQEVGETHLGSSHIHKSSTNLIIRIEIHD